MGHHQTKRPYVFKASWAATAKQFVVQATSLDEALEKATTSGESRGALTLALIKAPAEQESDE